MEGEKVRKEHRGREREIRDFFANYDLLLSLCNNTLPTTITAITASTFKAVKRNHN